MNSVPEEERPTPRLHPGLAALACEATLGASWYYNPRRWRTSDGFVPYGVMWDAWRALQSVEAQRRLSLARAMRFAQGTDDAHRQQWEQLVREEERLAYPPTPEE